MTPVVVSPKWKQNYDAQYLDYTDWRWIGSVDKFANLAKLCSNIPHHRVLEIGPGEGALLKRMEQAEFAEELYSLEISRVRSLHWRPLHSNARRKPPWSKRIITPLANRISHLSCPTT